MNSRSLPRTVQQKSYFAGILTGVVISVCLFLAFGRNRSLSDRVVGSSPSSAMEGSRDLGSLDAATRKRNARRTIELERQNEIGRLSTYGEQTCLLGTDGRINPQAAEEIGLSRKNVVETQGILDTAWERMSKVLSESAQYSERDSRREGVDVYHIEPLDDDAKEEMIRLQAELESSIGGKLAAKVIESSRLKDFFGGFGRQRITVRLEPISDDWTGEQSTKVSYECRDPLTGDVIRRGTTTPEAFRAQFGIAFRPQ
jgi:hypothetical protein